MKTIFEHHFFGEKKARVFRLLHFLSMVNSTWVGEWMRIGRRHPLHSSKKVPMYLLVCPPLQMNQLTLRSNRLKLKTSGNHSVIYTSNYDEIPEHVNM
jgi:hypothetical protein